MPILKKKVADKPKAEKASVKVSAKELQQKGFNKPAGFKNPLTK